MLVTNILAQEFTNLVKNKRLSPYEATYTLKEDPRFKGYHIPCVSNWV